jgi:lysophospholipase L1-like esterase
MATLPFTVLDMKYTMRFAAGLALSSLLLHASAIAAQHAAPSEEWVGVWGYVGAPLPPGVTPAAPPPILQSAAVPLGPTPNVPPPRTFPPPLLDNPGQVPVETVAADLTNVTVRQLVRVTEGGRRIRLRLSNEGGSDTLVLGAVHIGEAGADGTLVGGSDHTVTFDGQAGVSIPASAPVLSDPVELPTRALDKLYISIHVPGTVPARAPRSLFEYVAGEPGDFTGSATLPQVRLERVPAYVTLVESQPSAPTNVLVTLGDSITEGAASTANAFRSWPDRLAERLAGHHWAVVNAGISGNRLLRYGAGPNALARLDRDVLSVPGIKAIILLEGINDIGRGFAATGPTEPVDAAALEAADKQIILRAHEHGVRVIGATLTPYEGATYASPAGEAVREQLNTWIKTGGAFDAVIDFAPSVADPDNPRTFAKQYNDRDHLHPNDVGYKAMADSVNLSVILGK